MRDIVVTGGTLRALEARLVDTDPDYARAQMEVDDSSSATVTLRNRLGLSRELNCDYTVFNRDASPDDITLLVMGWGNDFKQPSTSKSLAAIALARPDQTFFVMNFLNNGDSSIMPLRTALRMAGGSYIPAGELYTALAEDAPEVKQAQRRHILSESRGDRLATGAVAAGLVVEDAAFSDGPGMRKLGLRGLRRGFAQIENGHARQYREANGVEEQAPDIRSEVRARLLDGSALTHYLLEPWALSRAGQFDDISAALPNIRRSARFITLECSGVTDMVARCGAIAYLALHQADRPPDITHTIAHGLTHNYGVGSRAARALLLAGNGIPEKS